MADRNEEALVQVADRGAVRTLTLNRPQALNAFVAALVDRLVHELDAAAEDRSVRCVVVTGAGRAFCAGQDLADASIAPGGDAGDLIERQYKPLALRLQSMPVPVVAAVNGVAAGAGANIALCCDIVVAAKSASFIQAFAKIGLVPDCGGTWLLPRLVGRGKAMALAMTGDKLPADEAERIGLIWRCIEDAAFAAETALLAERLSKMPTRALAATRAAIDAAFELDLGAAISHEARVQGDLSRSNDFKEGVAAFMAKRPAAFSDR